MYHIPMNTPQPTLDPSSTIIRAAKMLTPIREAGQNRGRFVEAIIKYAGGKPGDKWCAAFVYYVGHKMLGALWRLPKTLSCDELLLYAEKHNMLSHVPYPGCLFLVMASPTDATHVGFVAEVLVENRFTTVEGNSNDRGLRDGDGVVSNVRNTDGPTTYKFIVWNT